MGENSCQAFSLLEMLVVQLPTAQALAGQGALERCTCRNDANGGNH